MKKFAESRGGEKEYDKKTATQVPVKKKEDGRKWSIRVF